VDWGLLMLAVIVFALGLVVGDFVGYMRYGTHKTEHKK